METNDDTEERTGRMEHVSVGARRATSRLFALRKILYAERAAGGGEAPARRCPASREENREMRCRGLVRTGLSLTRASVRQSPVLHPTSDAMRGRLGRWFDDGRIRLEPAR